MYKKFLCAFFISLLSFTLICSKSCIFLYTSAEAESYPRWVDFNLTYEALKDAMEMDTESWEQDIHTDWISLLSCLSVKYGGDFSSYRKSDLTAISEKLKDGEKPEALSGSPKLYRNYLQGYSAVLGNLLGIRKDGSYGLTAFSPLGAGCAYSDGDDFGNGRDFGYRRRHLGHDMFCSSGSPVIAVEDGTIEALGWNPYGGWRIGLRSTDGLRYYYYAHLRKNSPYRKGLQAGDRVKAGQLLGYSGQTGYSTTPDTNNISVPHLHFGIQLIFDESQKDGKGEIWIDPYPVVQLLSAHRSCGNPESSTASAKLPADRLSVPILMYHGLTDKASRVNRYFIPVSTFASDLKYLRDNGYTAITLHELIRCIEDPSGKIHLPEKPVMLTFDDGYCNNFRLATPLLAKYHMKGVISVIGSACEEASNAKYRAEAYCNVTWDQLKEMQASGLWEIQNHTYDLHKNANGRHGASRKKGEDEAAYRAVLSRDLLCLQKKLRETVGTSPEALAWPYGAYPEDSAELLSSLGFKAALTCNGGINQIAKGDTKALYFLKRQLRTPDADLQSLLR